MAIETTEHPERQTHVLKAKLAEKAERHEEMAEAMKEAVLISAKLSVEERNLLSVAYKNFVGTRRASWRAIATLEEKENAVEAAGVVSVMLPLVREYRKKIEDELRKICRELLVLLDDHLVPGADDHEAKVFYMKMKGDYNRYLAEISSGTEDHQIVKKAAMDAYEKAHEEAVRTMPPVHPIRLGLALNYSVFHCEILSDVDKACTIAKAAFDDAIAMLDTLPDENYKDATLIMQLIRDNLALWTSDQHAAAANAVGVEVVDDDQQADGGQDGGAAGGNGGEVGDAERAAAAAQ
jgi:14-3-3 protein epsilon